MWWPSTPGAGAAQEAATRPGGGGDTPLQVGIETLKYEMIGILQ
jgi:hypothetical protein